MTRRAVVAVLLGAALLGTRSARAQEISEGDRVYAIQEAVLKIEAEIVATAQKDAVLSVREISGKWLWVETEAGERGWIDRQFVTLAAPEPTSPPSTAPVPPSPGTPGPAAASNEVEGRLLLAVGALSGQNVYITYAYIGTVADGYGNQVYTAEQVQELMREVVGLCSVAGDYLRQLAESEISADDRTTIEQMSGILDLLKREADALSSFAGSESQKDLDAYEAARTAVWPQIQSALGIK